jgi:hypothetical protein
MRRGEKPGVEARQSLTAGGGEALPDLVAGRADQPSIGYDLRA